MFRIKVWLTTAIITAGVAGGVIFNWPSQKQAVERESPTNIGVDNKPLHSREGIPLSTPLIDNLQDQTALDPLIVDLDIDHIEQGDQYLLAGNIDGAHREFAKATNDHRADPPASLLIRLALATELRGDHENANHFYREAVRRSTNGSTAQILGLTGVARTWQATGHPVEAHEMLSELFLRYICSEQLNEEVKYQIACQLGDVIQQKCLEGLKARGAMDQLEFHWPEPSLDAMVELLQDEGDARPAAAPNNADDPPLAKFQVLQRPSPDVNLIAVDSHVRLTQIDEILYAFAQQADLDFEASVLARDVITGRSSRLDVSGMPLAMVLDQLLSPLGLIWIQRSETIHIYLESEAVAESRDFQFAIADRVLRTIELVLSRDIRRDAAILHRGNIAFLQQDIDTAATRYAELEKLVPNDELAAQLSFNMAIVSVANDQNDEAIRQMFYAVDQSLDQRLQAKSYAWIGRLELQNGRSDKAVYALSRGLALSTNAQVREDALMNLSKAYLLASDPFSANRVLFNHADAVVDKSQRRKAAVFSAYARYLGMAAGDGLRNEAERMVVALASISPEDTVGFVDRLLIGRAFYEVGFKSRSTEFLQLALEAAPNEHWRRRVAFELATNQYRAGELSAAAEHYQSLVGSTPDATSLYAQLKLADIALSQRDPEKCLTICREIWRQNISEPQKAETLSLMGRAYQRLGRHEVAALCFSGLLPHKVVEATSPVNRRRLPTYIEN
ncbi:tetratricopeptide repeat protein [Mariniblastus fucicola]|uniref:Tetratricopeptide repeat protein n=1 Tax=Mariniblastus fucicola TaxID=980251 RepID=A0A5B9PFE4_9BACT|nr:hypothetical protein [Mariniblastus fucicola]QEG23356.1 Tetratricopeptide repeat protein [Mariniblastus fucicola]